ncbi:hypothetical protein [Jiangella endophytica]|uniref:hypothetical protein n=1 Tax=Jiangella endophytica TaxID=1623398 RepID=UPI000E353ED1|nr:hypothetical protein [Jiangella endophytica]
MTAAAATPDPTMEAISKAVVSGREGNIASARCDLLAIWQQIGAAGDPFHRCTLAHYLADLHEDPAEALIWDVRALDAATALTDERAQQFDVGFDVAGFLPSLYLNLADNFRRLGSFDTANTHLSTARELSDALSAGPYADQMTQWITQVADLIDKKSVQRLAGQAATHDGGEE